MRILYDNDLDGATLTESTEDASYPVENIQDTRLAKVWRAGGCSSESIVIDLGATAPCSVVAFVNHNLSVSAGCQIQHGTSAAAALASPTTAASITQRSGIMAAFFGTAESRYWAVTFADDPNTDGYIELGRAFIGQALQIAPSSNPEIPIASNRSDMQTFTRHNQFYGDEGVEYKTYTYAFPYASDTMRAAVQTMFDTVGGFKPLIFMNFDTTFDVIEPEYAVITGPIEFQHRAGPGWSWELELRGVT